MVMHRSRHGGAMARRLARPGMPRRNLEHPTNLEPAQNQPWVARSAFTGRSRRSPRT